MSDDEGFGDLFGGVDEEPEYPLQTLSIDRRELAAEGVTYDTFTPLLDRFDHISSLADAPTELAVLRARLEALAPPPLEVNFRDKRHSLWGHKLWNAAKYLVKRMDERLIDVRGKSVIELGAGLGVPSLAAYKNGARLSVVTDYPDADLLDIIRLNVEKNCAAGAVDADVQSDDTPRCIVEPLLWGNTEHIAKVMQHTIGGAGYHIVFLSDILFNHVCNDDLADTLAILLAKHPEAAGYCVFSHHRAFKQLHDFEFFDKCVRRGLQYEQLDEQEYPMMFPEDRGPESVRQPVKCYKITRRYDAAGHGLDVQLGFDVVLQGTGLVQSILSAALARSGLKVLHLDGEDHYAAVMATLDDLNFVRHIETSFFSSAAVTEELTAVIAVNRMSELSADRRRRYLFDLLPMAYLARGPTLRKVATAGMTSTLECQHIARLLFLQHRRTTTASTTSDAVSAMEVPLTRASVFANTVVSLFDKRRMMRFVKDVEASVAEQMHAKTANPADDPSVVNTSAAAEEAAAAAAAVFASAAAADPTLTLSKVLEEKYSLTGTALEVVSLMGMMDVLPCAEDTNTSAAAAPLVRSVEMERDLLLSTGAFNGRSPYLTTSYGAGELAQSMCRVSAVWGGSFILRRSLAGVAVDEEKEVQYAVLSNGQWVPARVIVSPQEVIAANQLRYNVQNWYYDVLTENECGRTPLLPPHLANANTNEEKEGDSAKNTVTSPAAAQDVEAPTVQLSRVVIATKTRSLFTWSALQSGMVVEVDAARDFLGAAPVIVALVREPVTRAVVVMHQQTFACDQAPPRFAADGEGEEECDPCVLHFTADAAQLSQTQLLAYVRVSFLDAGTEANGTFCRVLASDVVLMAAFTLDAADVALRGLVADPVDLPSETRFTHPFAWGESTKLRDATAHERAHLLHASNTASTTGEDEREVEQKTATATSRSVAAHTAAMCRASSYLRMVEVPSLLPNFVYDGHYMQCAEAAYGKVLSALGIEAAGTTEESNYTFLKAVPTP